MKGLALKSPKNWVKISDEGSQKSALNCHFEAKKFFEGPSVEITKIFGPFGVKVSDERSQKSATNCYFEAKKVLF